MTPFEILNTLLVDMDICIINIDTLSDMLDTYLGKRICEHRYILFRNKYIELDEARKILIIEFDKFVGSQHRAFVQHVVDALDNLSDILGTMRFKFNSCRTLFTITQNEYEFELVTFQHMVEAFEDLRKVHTAFKDHFLIWRQAYGLVGKPDD